MKDDKYKDDKYYELLEKVTNRVVSNWSWEDLSDLGNKMKNNVKNEMKSAKNILLSSGHDLEDVNDFYDEVNRKVSAWISNFSL